MTQRYYTVKHPAYFRRRRFPKRFFVWFLLIGVLAGSGIHAVFFSGFLAVDTIELRGIVKTPADDLKALVLQHLDGQVLGRVPRNNIALVPAQEITRKILERFPRLSSAVVRKKYPHSITVEVAERQYAGVWCAASQPQTASSNQTVSEDAPSTPTTTSPLIPLKCFLVDAEGVAYSEAAESSGVLQLRIIEARDNEPQLGTEVIDPHVLDFFRRAKDALEKRFGIRTSHFEIRGLPDATVYTAHGWQILLDATKSLDAALDSFKETIEIIDQRTTRIEYIDLRIEGRVYYKTAPPAMNL